MVSHDEADPFKSITYDFWEPLYAIDKARA